jgi:hypothetical protein
VDSGTGTGLVDSGTGTGLVDSGTGTGLVNSGTGTGLVDSGSGTGLVDSGTGRGLVYSGTGTGLVDSGTGTGIFLLILYPPPPLSVPFHQYSTLIRKTSMFSEMDSQDLFHFLYNLSVHYRVYKSLLLNPFNTRLPAAAVCPECSLFSNYQSIFRPSPTSVVPLLDHTNYEVPQCVIVSIHILFCLTLLYFSLPPTSHLTFVQQIAFDGRYLC